jgi:hypothetical protein
MKRNDKEKESRYASYVENKIQLGIVHLRSSFSNAQNLHVPAQVICFERFKGDKRTVILAIPEFPLPAENSQGVWLNFSIFNEHERNDLIMLLSFKRLSALNSTTGSTSTVNGKGPPTEERAIFPVGTSKASDDTSHGDILKERSPFISNARALNTFESIIDWSCASMPSSPIASIPASMISTY